MDYCLSLKGFDEKISLKFISTLKDFFAVVKGLKIEFTKDIVPKVTSFPHEGKTWAKDLDLHLTRA